MADTLIATPPGADETARVYHELAGAGSALFGAPDDCVTDDHGACR